VISGFLGVGRIISFTGLRFSNGEAGGSTFLTIGTGAGLSFGGGGLATFFSGFF